MATRAQVQLSDTRNNQKVTLYHHWDGYVENMVPLLQEAYEKAKSRLIQESRDSVTGREVEFWKLGRAGKSGSYLCSHEPEGFEVESSNSLHGDIEYLYRIFCVNPEGGHIGDQCYWEMEVLVPKEGFWENPRLKNMKVLIPRQRLESIPTEK